MHFDEGRLPDGKVMDAENEKKAKKHPASPDRVDRWWRQLESNQ